MTTCAVQVPAADGLSRCPHPATSDSVPPACRHHDPRVPRCVCGSVDNVEAVVTRTGSYFACDACWARWFKDGFGRRGLVEGALA